jgi:hypothetical protein
MDLYERTMPEMMTTKIHPNLIREQTTSISPNQLTAPWTCVSGWRQQHLHGIIHTDVDQYDDKPEDSHPRSNRNSVRPEFQHSIDSLKLIRDRDEVVEPVGPSHGEASSRIDELGRPLHKSGG